MKSKIVENWLTKVTELTFTVPFAQLLLSKGQRVVHISSQGPMEQGKDIIAVDAAGVVHCYQLKCGNINSKSFGKIKAEIDQLVELPPRHPSLPDKVDEWEAYLVTNGRIANPTARDITDYAESKQSKGHRPLKTIVGSELVADFTNFYDDFIPVDVVDLQTFLELCNQPGDNELDLGKFKVLFETFFRQSSDASRQKKIEAIRASLVLCNYILTNKHAKQNHFEIIKAHVLLLASVYEFVEGQRLADSLWRDTEALLYEAINLEFRQLIGELESHSYSYVQTEYGLLSEVLVYKIRCTELLGYLAAYNNYCWMAGVKACGSSVIEGILAKLSKHKALLGESAVPLFVNYVLALHFAGSDAEARQELVALLVAIVSSHYGEESRGLPGPYYDISQAVDWSFDRAPRIKETFKWRSYTLRALILLAARYDLRSVLNDAWRVLSRITQHEVIPADAKDYLLWSIQEGELADRFPDATQSWARLVAESVDDYSTSLPSVLQRRKHFLPLLINVMPHRFNHRIAITILDGQR